MQPRSGLPGRAEARLDIAGRLYAIGIRLLTLPLACVVAVMTADDAAMLVRSTLALTVFTAWSMAYLWLIFRSAPTWTTAVDGAALAALGTAVPWLVSSRWLAQGSSWLVPFATFCCVAYQYYAPVGPAVAATVAVMTAMMVGTALGRPPEAVDAGLVTAGWGLVVALLARVLWESVSRAARRADAKLDETEAARRGQAVAMQIRLDAEAVNAALHDTAASTLLMVGLGVAAAIEDVLPDRAARDLAVLQALHERRLPPYSDLAALLREVVRLTPLEVDFTIPRRVPLPAVAAQALADAAGESLMNIIQHAGVQRARLLCELPDPSPADPDRRDGDDSTDARTLVRRVRVVVEDDGTGFDRARVPETRRGLVGSIEGRMTAAGGRAVVRSAPGQGTTVSLEWPA